MIVMLFENTMSMISKIDCTIVYLVAQVYQVYMLERAKLTERASSSFCYTLLIPIHSVYENFSVSFNIWNHHFVVVHHIKLFLSIAVSTFLITKSCKSLYERVRKHFPNFLLLSQKLIFVCSDIKKNLLLRTPVKNVRSIGRANAEILEINKEYITACMSTVRNVI